MSAASFTANLAAFLLQTTLLLAAGLLLPRLFGMRDPHIRLRYWHALLAFSLVLPFVWLAARPPAAPAVSFTGRLAGGMEVQMHAGPAPSSPWVWVPVVLGAVAAARALWLLGGLLLLERLRRRSRVLDPLPQAFAEASDALLVNAEFRTSPSVSTPLTFGWVRPVVLLPEAVTEMSPESQRCIALHELLHVRRRDWLAILLEESLRSLLWFHPALWLVLDRVALSREQSVDMEVVRITEARIIYMSTLSAMARTRQGAAAVAILPFFHRSHLLQRLALLTKEVSMSKLRWRLAVAGSAVVLLLAGAVAARSFPLLHGPSAPPRATGQAAHGERYELALRTGTGSEPGQYRFVLTVVDSKTNEVVFSPEVLTRAGEPATASAESPGGPSFTFNVAFNEGDTQARYAFVAREGQREIQREEGKVLLVGALKPGVYDDNQEGITEPKLIKRVEFVRPAAAPDKYTPAIVVLGLVITREGVPTDIKVIKSGSDALDTATIDAVSQFRWEPARLDGKPVDFRSTFTVRWGVDREDSAQESQPASMIPRPDDPPAAEVTGTASPVDGIYPMGSIEAPKIITQVNPVYPEEARKKGLKCRVVLEIVINPKGEPTQIKVLKSDNEIFNASAKEAVAQWRYESPMHDGKPVSVRWIIHINFTATK